MNVFTSYLRIYPKNYKAMSDEEKAHLFYSLVEAYGAFGSYWVRIWKNWNDKENCLEIQYGSSKNWRRENNILDDQSFYDNYFLWERWSHDGGFSDELNKYHFEWKAEYDWSNCESETCIYTFDQLLANRPLPELSDFDFSKEKEIYSYHIQGRYHACNSLSRVDMVDEYSGPCLGYDENYIPSKFNEGFVVDCIDPENLSYLFQKNTSIDKNLPTLELKWRGKTVFLRRWEFCEYVNQECWVEYSADTWDNLKNIKFLEFKDRYEKRLKNCRP